LSDEGAGGVRSLIREWVEDSLLGFLPKRLHPEGESWRSLVDEITDQVRADTRKCKQDDAAAANKSEEHVFVTCRPLKAIGLYRIAHRLLALEARDQEDRSELERVARTMTESGASAANVDIHPEAEIGVPLRIDHGRGVVIGQQVRIGDNCALMNHVILGALGMNPKAGGEDGVRRHPTLGNDVEIYEDASVLGNVTVHDGATIGQGCKVRFDVPAGCTVQLISQVEVATGEGCHEVHGLRWPGGSCLEIWGVGLSAVSPCFVDSEHEALEGIECHLAVQEDELLRIEVTVQETGLEVLSPPRLKLSGQEKDVVVVQAKALKNLWRNCDVISREPAHSSAAGR
jgi:serine acetyltransferase